MPERRERARAKLNLALDVLGRRPDGYHDMRMVMQSVTLADDVTVAVAPGTGQITVTTNRSYLPSGEQNLAGKAARVYLDRAEIRDRDVTVTLVKRIPVCAGMGGGSSDAAAVLRALAALLPAGLNRGELEALGARVGSDVPFCVAGGAALAEGRGELLTPLPCLPDCDIVLCKPSFPVSTPALFAALDGTEGVTHPDPAGLAAALERGSLTDAAALCGNAFSSVLTRGADQVAAIRERMLRAGALTACMTGTGPTVFGLFSRHDPAERAARDLARRWRDTFLCRPAGETPIETV